MTTVFTTAPKISEIACEETNMTLKCAGKFIKVLHALYGRKENGTCGGPDSDANCRARGAYQIVSSKCDGRLTGRLARHSQDEAEHLSKAQTQKIYLTVEQTLMKNGTHCGYNDPVRPGYNKRRPITITIKTTSLRCDGRTSAITIFRSSGYRYRWNGSEKTFFSAQDTTPNWSLEKSRMR